mmetsp:Transcript_473/g.1146  ORF Transcript_473/g.1146 Transcript_473/m.1146 type:complete len:410 (+) Transcript_473:183-1412(+)
MSLLHKPRARFLTSTCSLLVVLAALVIYKIRKARLGHKGKLLGLDPQKYASLKPGIRIGRVAKLQVYPMKSCRAVSCESIQVSKDGVLFDRVVCVVNKNGIPVSQRMRPELAQIETSFSIEDNLVILKAPKQCDLEPLYLNIAQIENNLSMAEEIDMYGAATNCIAFQEDASKWITTCLSKLSGRELSGFRILCTLKGATRHPANTPVQTILPHLKAEDGMRFGDLSPFSLASKASLDAVKNQMQDQSKASEIQVDNFRANIIMETESEMAFVEDHIAGLSIGEYGFRVIGDSFRCTETTVNQETGDAGYRKGLRTAEPLATLNRVRPSGLRVGLPNYFPPTRGTVTKWSASPLFGLYMGAQDVAKHGVIRVGDPIVITQVRSPLNIWAKIYNLLLLLCHFDERHMISN